LGKKKNPGQRMGKGREYSEGGEVWKFLRGGEKNLREESSYRGGGGTERKIKEKSPPSEEKKGPIFLRGKRLGEEPNDRSEALSKKKKSGREKKGQQTSKRPNSGHRTEKTSPRKSSC